MFNKTPFIIKKYVCLFVLISILSCKKEMALQFSEQLIEPSNGAEISILYPKAEGTSTAVNSINTTIKNHMVNALSFSEDQVIDLSIQDAIDAFNKEYKGFKEEFPDSAQRWNASIEGEVTYRSPEVISIAMNTYLDTGGAHGNDNITFLNFSSTTGKLIKNDALLRVDDELMVLAKSYFEKGIVKDEGDMEDYFYGEAFHLPANIGFSDEGLMFLYNVYEIASYAQGYCEFIIPFKDISPFLKVE